MGIYYLLDDAGRLVEDEAAHLNLWCAAGRGAHYVGLCPFKDFDGRPRGQRPTWVAGNGRRVVYEKRYERDRARTRTCACLNPRPPLLSRLSAARAEEAAAHTPPLPDAHYIYAIVDEAGRHVHVGKEKRVAPRFRRYLRDTAAGGYGGIWWLNDLMRNRPDDFERLRWKISGPFPDTDRKMHEARIREEWREQGWQASSDN